MNTLIIVEESVVDELFNKLLSIQEKLNHLCTKSRARLPDWIDNQEACFRLGVSKQTLRKLCTNGELSFTKIGSKTFYKFEDIQDSMIQRFHNLGIQRFHNSKIQG